MCKAPYARALPIWWLKPLQQLTNIMDFTQWNAGGCSEAGDLYVNGNFLDFPQAQDMFHVQPGQFLQNARLNHTVHKIWPVLPVESEESQTLTILLDTGTSRRLILRIYEVLKTYML